MKNIKATSLIEVVIASLILAIVFAGLVAGFVSVRKYIARSQKRLVGTNVSRVDFSALTAAVNAATWDTTSALAVGTTGFSLPQIDGVIYAGNVVVSSPSASANYRQANVNVNFPVD